MVKFVDDARAYLLLAQKTLHDQTEKYEEFRKLLKDFGDQKIDDTQLSSTVKMLFDGYDDLVTGFNSFLPSKTKHVTASSEAYNSTVDNQASTSSWATQIEFVRKVQKRFGDDVRRYKSFLVALGMWRFGDRVIDRLDQEVAGVFKEFPDLYMEFKGFYGDFSEEISADKQANRQELKTQRNEKLYVQQEAETYLRLVKQTFHDQTEKYYEFINVVKDYLAQKIDETLLLSIVKKLFDGYDDLVTGLKAFLPANKTVITSPEVYNNVVDDETQTSSWTSQIEFFNKVGNRFLDDPRMFKSFIDAFSRWRLGDKDITQLDQEQTFHDQTEKYYEFINVVKDYLAQKIDETLLLSIVKKLFDGYDDLVTGLKAFLPANKTVITSPEVYNNVVDDETQTSSWTSQIEFFNKVGNRFLDDPRMFKSFIDAFSRWRLGDKDITQLDQEVCVIFKDHHDLYIEFKGFCESNQPERDNKYKDLCFVQIEDHPYKQTLLDCEHNLFEIDMLRHRLKSTKEAIEKLLGDIKLLDKREEQGREVIDIAEYFTVLNLICIERLYNDHGLNVLNLLRQNPATVASIIASRLNLKLKECDEMKVVCEITYKKCHEKVREYSVNFLKNRDSNMDDKRNRRRKRRCI
ncbi:unnamed protein product [Ilex paraguariensis]|uniref:Exocyst complex component Sec6 n=1 Tax=Ilex paraguariensis TaxID=185542 RepID=A0ABC8RZ67_9AQUA